MGRHSAPDHDEPTVPILRMPTTRSLRSQERSVAGVAFPVVDDLSLIASDDRLLDSIAAGRTEFDDLFVLPAPAFAGFADRAVATSVRGVAPLLALWRAQVVDPPMPTLPALAVPRRVMHAPADRHRSLRPMLAAGAAICALLMGSTAVGAQSARPGDALWGLTQVLYSDHALSLEAQARVNSLVIEASQALDLGDTAKASSLLISARGRVDQVLPTDGRANLERDVNGLQSKLATKQTSADRPTPPDHPTDAGSSPGRALNANTPSVARIIGSGAGSSRPSAASSSVAAPIARATAGTGSATSVASNPVFGPPPVPTLPPTTPPAAPVTPIAAPTTATPTVASPTSIPPVDPIITTPVPSSPSVTDSTTSVVIAPTTTTPSATDTVTTSSADPAVTDTSTTSVMPTPTPTTDTTSSVTDVTGVLSVPTTGTGP